MSNMNQLNKEIPYITKSYQNLANKSKLNVANKSGNILKNIIIISTFVILGLVILYLLAMLYNYIYTGCYVKKDLMRYMMDMDFDACDKAHDTLPYIERKILDDEEVFHISNQDYTYQQAQCKCHSYGSKLASKEQITDAYNKGANWCTYGWSAGQSAYYPTQKCEWDKLQNGPKKHRYDCGMPGVNGGFFASPLLKFGVNCYGIRPRGKIVQPKKAECSIVNNGKNFCKMQRNAGKLDTDKIVPFNRDQWSEYK